MKRLRFVAAQFRAFSLRMLGLVRKSPESDFDLEMESHLQLHIDDHVRSGLSPQEARRRALIALGGIEQTREAHRDQRSIPLLETFLRDLRYAARGLRRNPGFAVSAVVILALGIGVNTAIFTLVNAVVLRPLPFRDSERIMRLWHTPPPKLFVGFDTFSLSPGNFLDWRDQSRSFEHMAAYRSRPQTLTGRGEADAVFTGEASADLFPVLGLDPILGRTFTKAEDDAGGEQVAILGEALWRNRFGADPSVVGQAVTIDGAPRTIIGVVPDPGAVLQRIQLWLPLAWSAETRAVRANHNYFGVAKLRQGVDVATAQTELTTISKRLELQYPADNKEWGALVRPLQEDLVRKVRGSLLLLLGAVGLVLLIACANLANLLLVRTHARAKEIAVRTALGAGRGRVMVQMLTEGLLLGSVGGALGLVAAYFGVNSLVAAFGTALPRASEVAPDGRVLAFTFAVASLAGLLAAAVPAFRLTRSDATEILKRGGRGNSTAGDGRVRNLLVVSEISLALMLLVGAGLLIKSLGGLRGVDPGFDGRGVVTMTLNIPEVRYKTDQQKEDFFRRVVHGVRAIPGVESASSIDSVPLRGGSAQPVTIDRLKALPQSELPIVAVRFSSSGYFDTFRIPIVSGRDFADTDVSGQPKVALVSELAARRLWPDESPLGKRLTLSLMSMEEREVVGVVRDVRMDQLDDGSGDATVYIPAAQQSASSQTLVVRAPSVVETISRTVVAKVREIDAEQPVLNIMTMDAVVERSLGQRPLAMLLLSGFAGLALALATIGIYSVIAYSVGQRIREIGIRMALGAPAKTVLRMIVLEGLKPTLAGLAVGLVFAALLVRFLTSQLYGVSAYDPGTFLTVATIVIGVGVIASAVPAYRATRIDPMLTLRSD